MAWLSDKAYAKKKNTRALLDLISQQQPVSRIQIADMMELSPASITRIVGALFALGLVQEEGLAQSEGRGRKARILTTRPDGLYTIGVCVEPDKLLLGVNDFHQRSLYLDQKQIDADRVKTPEALAQLVGDMYRKIDRSLISDWSRVRVMGVSVPGLVDAKHGVVQKSDQFMWDNACLRAPFEKAVGLPIWVENDVKACLIGEKARRSIPRKQDTVYLLVGTGVGIAATSNGKVVRGYTNRAGEVEHLNLAPVGVYSDTLQTHMVEKRILENALSACPELKSLDDLITAYRQNIGFARLQIADFEKYLRLALSMIDCFYDPESIILGGSTLIKFAPLIDGLLGDSRISIGEDYEKACVLGACIGAEDYALEKILDPGELPFGDK